MQRTNIYLDERQIEALDRLAGDRGVSRAEVIRKFIDLGVGGQIGDLGADLAALSESAGAAPELVVPDRAADERARYLGRIRGRVA